MASPYVFLPHRSVLSLAGPDTVAMLERLVTHGTGNWAPGETRYGALLTPQGKVIADYLALRTAEGVLLDVATEALADLKKRLTLFRLRADVTIEVREDLFVIAGTEAAEHGVRPISGAAHVLVDPRFAEGRLRGFATEAAWQGWYGVHAAEWSRPLPAYHLDRMAHGVAEWGADFGAAEVFPADINMDRMGGVDLKKGCFVGQEVVSRMHRRGKIRRRTVALEGEGLEVGQSLEVALEVAGSGSIGAVTSAEGGRGLARVRIDRLAKARRGAGDGEGAVTAEGAAVSLVVPDWLSAEMAEAMADG